METLLEAVRPLKIDGLESLLRAMGKPSLHLLTDVDIEALQANYLKPIPLRKFKLCFVPLVHNSRSSAADARGAHDELSAVLDKMQLPQLQNLLSANDIECADDLVNPGLLRDSDIDAVARGLGSDRDKNKMDEFRDFLDELRKRHDKVTSDKAPWLYASYELSLKTITPLKANLERIATDAYNALSYYQKNSLRELEHDRQSGVKTKERLQQAFDAADKKVKEVLKMRAALPVVEKRLHQARERCLAAMEELVELVRSQGGSRKALQSSALPDFVSKRASLLESKSPREHSIQKAGKLTVGFASSHSVKYFEYYPVKSMDADDPEDLSPSRAQAKEELEARRLAEKERLHRHEEARREERAREVERERERRLREMEEEERRAKEKKDKQKQKSPGFFEGVKSYLGGGATAAKRSPAAPSHASVSPPASAHGKTDAELKRSSFYVTGIEGYYSYCNGIYSLPEFVVDEGNPKYVLSGDFEGGGNVQLERCSTHSCWYLWRAYHPTCAHLVTSLGFDGREKYGGTVYRDLAITEIGPIVPDGTSTGTLPQGTSSKGETLISDASGEERPFTVQVTGICGHSSFCNGTYDITGEKRNNMPVFKKRIKNDGERKLWMEFWKGESHLPGRWFIKGVKERHTPSGFVSFATLQNTLQQGKVRNGDISCKSFLIRDVAVNFVAKKVPMAAQDVPSAIQQDECRKLDDEEPPALAACEAEVTQRQAGEAADKMESLRREEEERCIQERAVVAQDQAALLELQQRQQHEKERQRRQAAEAVQLERRRAADAAAPQARVRERQEAFQRQQDARRHQEDTLGFWKQEEQAQRRDREAAEAVETARKQRVEDLRIANGAEAQMQDQAQAAHRQQQEHRHREVAAQAAQEAQESSRLQQQQEYEDRRRRRELAHAVVQQKWQLLSLQITGTALDGTYAYGGSDANNNPVFVRSVSSLGREYSLQAPRIIYSPNDMYWLVELPPSQSKYWFRRLPDAGSEDQVFSLDSVFPAWCTWWMSVKALWMSADNTQSSAVGTTATSFTLYSSSSISNTPPPCSDVRPATQRTTHDSLATTALVPRDGSRSSRNLPASQERESMDVALDVAPPEDGKDLSALVPMDLISSSDSDSDMDCDVESRPLLDSTARLAHRAHACSKISSQSWGDSLWLLRSEVLDDPRITPNSSPSRPNISSEFCADSDKRFGAKQPRTWTRRLNNGLLPAWR